MNQKLKINRTLFFLLISFLTWTANAANISTEDGFVDNEIVRFGDESSLNEFSIFFDQQKPTESHIQQVFSGLISGTGAYDLKGLQGEWGANPNSISTGVVISLAFIRAKEFDNALDTAKKLQRLHPGSFEGYALAGIVYSILGERKLSTKAFHKALELKPGQPSVSYNLSLYALKDGDIEQAKTLYENVLKYNPKHLQTLIRLSVLEANVKNTKHSLELLKTAIKLNPEAIEPRVIMARQFLIENKPQDAIHIIQPLAEKFSQSSALLNVKGRAELAKGDYKAAVQSFIHQVNLNSNDTIAHYFLAAAYDRTGDVNNALNELDKVLQIDSLYKPARLAKARLYKRMGEVEKALALYQDIFNDKPENSILLVIARLKWSIGEQGNAISMLEKWVAKHPKDEAILVELAKAYEAKKRKVEAIKTYRKILTISADNLLALNNLAWSLQDSNTDKALLYVKKAYLLKPDSAIILDTYAGILQKKGDLVKAEKMIEQALKLVPENSSLLYRKASILEKEGKIKLAKLITKSLLKHDKKFPERLEAQKMLQRLSK